jgi:maltose O-acetyltransferase
MKPVRRTLAHMLAHAVNALSSVLGDDWVGRKIRVAVLSASGAKLARGTTVHGGTRLTVPWNLQTGRDCFINNSCYFDLNASISLGDGVVIGHGTTLVTSQHEIGPSTCRAGPARGLPILIGSGAWLGSNVTVLPGITIGPGAVIGAGAVVSRDIPSNVLAAGVPARVMRRLDNPSPGS